MVEASRTFTHFRLQKLCTAPFGTPIPKLGIVEHQAWGRTTYGDGFVYGQTFASFGVAVVDIDVDKDYDFIL
ncbi:MAG: hypothetical protein QGG73_14025, partial [Candidatus Hydrogenedentes bacterium]|nr:hypothetical protein [Candidatus Hydrogenedentota bacterium]